MEERKYNGNLELHVFEENRYNEEETAKIANGEYPIIVAQNGVFTKRYTTADLLCKFTHWNAKDVDRAEQAALHGHLPIVWEAADDAESMIETGIEPKVEEPTE